MLFQLMCYLSKLCNEYRKIFCSNTDKNYTASSISNYECVHLVPGLKSPFYSDFAPEG